MRERLKAEGFQAAPVLACIGRDRLILKEINIPAVGAAEEAAVVRFQAVKELSHAPEDLRAFAQIELAPHASGDVTLRLRADDLRHWNTATSAWVLEPIDYQLRVGRHAGDVQLATAVHALP